MEKVVHSQFYEFLNSHDLLSRKQFGFRPKYSTVIALSNFSNEVLLNMEEGNLCGAVFLDLKKAFDAVDHCILLTKLSEIGVSLSSFKWFESYLNNRKQRLVLVTKVCHKGASWNRCLFILLLFALFI